MEDDNFCLRWNNHQHALLACFDSFLRNGTLVDCTLAAEGRFLKAHKVVLSACSPYFAALLSEQYDKHPIFILKDIKFQELQALMDYMYKGEMEILSRDQLANILKVAESLQIQGLSKRYDESTETKDSSVKEAIDSNSDKVKPAANKRSSCAALEYDESTISISSGEFDTVTQGPTSSEPIIIRKRRLQVNDINHKQSFKSRQVDNDKNINEPLEQRKQHDTEPKKKCYNNAELSQNASQMEPSAGNKDKVLSSAPEAGKQNCSLQQINKTKRVGKLCKSSCGADVLFHGDFVYDKVSISATDTTYWRCRLWNIKGCKGTALTKVINGTTMVKLTNSNHAH